MKGREKRIILLQDLGLGKAAGFSGSRCRTDARLSKRSGLAMQ